MYKEVKSYLFYTSKSFRIKQNPSLLLTKSNYPHKIIKENAWHKQNFLKFNINLLFEKLISLQGSRQIYN